jgi:surface polysaccharide O-acyltransferase-like enzyme
MLFNTGTINKNVSIYVSETLPRTEERNVSIDLLRTLSMLMVVLLHVCAPYVNNGLNNEVFDTSFWVGNLIDSFSRVSVPIFVLISGSFLLGREDSYKIFYKKRLSRILWPLIFWGGMYALYVLLKTYYISKEWDLAHFIKSIISGKPFYHLWYLYMLVGLYLITPVINRAIKGLKLNEIRIAAYLLLLIGFAINVSNIYSKNNLIFILWFTEYLGYFLLGYVIINNPKKNNITSLLAIYTVFSLLIALLTYYFKNLYFYGYLSPLVIFASLALFNVFTQFNLANIPFARISKFTLGIYLVHAGPLDVLRLLEREYKLTTQITVIDILLKFALVLLASVLIVNFIRKIPKLNKTI